MMKFFVDVATAQLLYDGARKWFTIIPPLTCPTTFFIDAPFGRFALQKNLLSLDGIRSWIFMELVSVAGLLYSYLNSPLSATAWGSPPPLSLTHPSTLLTGLYLVHYANRAVISPLRTPSRSQSHLSVVLSAVAFNTFNGLLMGSYLSSPSAQSFLVGAFSRPTFWLGLGMWAAGLVGNIYHDEILLNIRRNAKAKGKAKSAGDDDDNRKQKNTQEHYAIPHGGLYRFISYPNYLCEWFEWLGFAIAAAPAPSFASYAAFMATISPPWLFFFNEIWVMIPRAYRGHKWYHSRFPDYPKQRKAVIPFLF